MSKVEMDMTEFKALEENKRLLEDSLQREKTLNDKLDKANQEKIEALEKAKNFVVKKMVRRTYKHEYRTVPKSGSVLMEGLESIARALENDRLRPIRHIDDRDHHLSAEMIIDQVFDKVSAEGGDVEDEVTFELSESLEAWKHSQLEDLKKEAEKSVQDELTDLRKFKEDNADSHKENKKLKKKNDELVQALVDEEEAGSKLASKEAATQSKFNLAVKYIKSMAAITGIMPSKKLKVLLQNFEAELENIE